MNYYDILNLPQQATIEQIKHSYRRLVLTYHPDKNQNNDKFKIQQINEAYCILSNTVFREYYDKQLIRRENQIQIYNLIRNFVNSTEPIIKFQPNEIQGNSKDTVKQEDQDETNLKKNKIPTLKKYIRKGL